MTFSPDILRDRVAVVTGGGTGIGEVIALTLAHHGAHVMLASRDINHLQPVCEKIRALGRDSLAFAMDVRQPGHIEAMTQQVLARFGKIDILVNNAAGNFPCRVQDLSVNGWNAVVNIVLNGTFYCSKIVGQTMIERRQGSIVNIGATYSWMAAPYTAHSGAAKAGVDNLTRTLAVEWGQYGIRVNCVSPGPIADTEGERRLLADHTMRSHLLKTIPLARLGTKQEIANAVLFLVSDAAQFITGHVLVVDGGLWIAQRWYAPLGRD